MRQPLYLAPAILWASLIFFLSSQESLPTVMASFPGMDKLVHATFYAILAGLLLFAARKPSPRAMTYAVLLTSLYGVTDEFHQYFVPGRSCDVLDWCADTTGAAVCMVIWRYKQKRKRHAAPF